MLGAGFAAAAGTLGGGLAAQAGAAEPLQVWGLDPDWGGDPATCGCSACASCLAHAANKLFASASAADGGRAHLYCKCLVVSLGEIDPGIYNALFTDGARRDSVDLRYQWVQAVLGRPAPVAAVFADDRPLAGALLAGMPAGAVRGAHAVRVTHATLGRVRIRRGSSGRRWLHVDLDAVEPVSVTLSITRQGPTLARQVESSVLGKHRFKVAIPNSAKAGPARLRLRIRDASGRVASITRMIQIPPA